VRRRPILLSDSSGLSSQGASARSDLVLAVHRIDSSGQQNGKRYTPRSKHPEGSKSQHDIVETLLLCTLHLPICSLTTTHITPKNNTTTCLYSSVRRTIAAFCMSGAHHLRPHSHCLQGFCRPGAQTGHCLSSLPHREASTEVPRRNKVVFRNGAVLRN